MKAGVNRLIRQVNVFYYGYFWFVELIPFFRVSELLSKATGSNSSSARFPFKLTGQKCTNCRLSVHYGLFWPESTRQ